MPRFADVSRVTRRTALGAMAAGGVGFALWPIRPRHERAVPAGRKLLTYWEKWTGPEGEAMQRIVDRFNAEQTRLWVRRLPVSDIVAKAMVAIGGGDPPDVCGLFNFNTPQFAEANAIIPFDELRSPGDESPESLYAPAISKLLTYEGRQWAGVSTAYTLALYYNRALFRAAGLDPGRPPRTVAELDECSARLTRSGVDGRLEQTGLMQNIPHWWPYFWPCMFGGTLFDDATDTVTLVTPENVAAYDWVASYPRRFGTTATQTFSAGFGRSFHSPQDPFLTGRVTMVVQGPWMANFIRRYASELDYACAPIPVTEALYDPDLPTGTLECDNLVIPRGGRDPEAAYEFVRFTQRQDVQEELATAHCKSSPLRAVSDAFMRDHPNRFVAVHDAIARSPRVQIAPATRVWPQYQAMMVAAFEAIWAGADVRTELARVQTRIQELVDLAAQRRSQRELRRGAARPRS